MMDALDHERPLPGGCAGQPEEPNHLESQSRSAGKEPNHLESQSRRTPTICLVSVEPFAALHVTGGT